VSALYQLQLLDEEPLLLLVALALLDQLLLTPPPCVNVTVKLPYELVLLSPE